MLVVTFKYMDGEAVLSNGIWTSNNSLLAANLNDWCSKLKPEPGYSPDADHAIAEKIISVLGDGEIVHYEVPYEYDPNAIY